MRFSNLKSILPVLAAVIGLQLLASSCNNDNKEENNSTTTVTDTATTTVTDANTTIPSTKTDTTATNTKTAKKIGKVSIKTAPVDRSVTMKADPQGYYNYTETAPAFPGGQTALEDYINNHLQYPQEAIDNNVEGTVYVMFTIDENGKVGNARTSGAALGSGLEDAAIQVVNGMTAWTPGTNKGKKVKGWYTLPITYRLE